MEKDELWGRYGEARDVIEGVLNNTHEVVVLDVEDIRMFFRGGGEMERHQFTLSGYLDEIERMMERFKEQRVNLLLVAKLRSHEHIKDILCWDDDANVECFVPAVYIDDNCDETITILILKK